MSRPDDRGYFIVIDEKVTHELWSFRSVDGAVEVAATEDRFALRGRWTVDVQKVRSDCVTFKKV